MRASKLFPMKKNPIIEAKKSELLHNVKSAKLYDFFKKRLPEIEALNLEDGEYTVSFKKDENGTLRITFGNKIEEPLLPSIEVDRTGTVTVVPPIKRAQE